MAASMDLNVQMDQIMTLGRPSRKAKDDANSKIIITDSNNFQHPGGNSENNPHIQNLTVSHYNNYYTPNTSGNMMSMDVQENYVDYGLQMNMNSNYNYDNRAKPFDIATINHSEQSNKSKIPEENVNNMGPPNSKKRRGRQSNHIITSVNGPNEMDSSLYASVRYGRAPIQNVVDDWIEQYNTNRVSAMLNLMQLFISSCGCKGKLTEEIFTPQVSQAQVIRKLTEEFDEDNGEYPLTQTTPQAKKFRANFVEFISVLIRQCQYSIIYDQQMIDQLTSLLTVLTDSQVRAFRYTGTLASMKLMTALVDVALNISINRDNNRRQLDAERNKPQQSQARMNLLTNRQRELDENVAEVRNMLTFLVKGVFVHRYRDSQPDIRCICMQEIGVWMQRLPEIFLDDSYLKYVGWTLYDRVGTVRAQCLRTLQPLYEEIGLVSKLELFTSRFKTRLVDMTLDKEVDVAVLAVKVVCCILKHNNTILDDRDCENIYELVYCLNRNLAQAAGDFLSLKLFQVDICAPVKKSRKGKRRSENTPLIRDLVQFFIESELHEHAGYLVDSLWDVSAANISNNNNSGNTPVMIRDWECMTDLLLEEPGKGETALTPPQETALLEILYWSVRQAATGESPVGRQSSSHHHHNQIMQTPLSLHHIFQNVKLSKSIQDERNKLTEILIPTLPALLAKYGEDTSKMLNIVQLPLYMNLELYTSGRHERYLDLLMKNLKDLVDRHTHSELLLHISTVFSCLCADHLSISNKCQIALGNLLDQLVDSYNQSYQQYYGHLSVNTAGNTHDNDSNDAENQNASSEPSQQDAYRLNSAIRKLCAFYACHDLRSLNVWQTLIRISQSALNQAVFHEEIVANAISTCHLALLWQLNTDDPQSLSNAELTNVQTNLTDFINTCHSYLEHKSHKIAEQSYTNICDLLIICSTCLTDEIPEAVPLVYEPDSDLVNAMILFLEQRVFVEDDSEEDENIKIEDLHNRRTHLSMFLKLMVANIIPIPSVSCVYRFYIRFFNDFGDIMKTGLAKAREISRVDTAKMVLECLSASLDDLIAEDSNLERTSEGFQSLKELARRLNLSFGLDLMKIREAMTSLHKMAIDCTVSQINPSMPKSAPPNLLILELAAEFSNKLTQPDKRMMLEWVTRALPNADESWLALHNYKLSLDPSVASAYDGGSIHSAGSANAYHYPNNNVTSTSVLSGQRSRGRPKKARDHSPPSPYNKKKHIISSSTTQNYNVSTHHQEPSSQSDFSDHPLQDSQTAHTEGPRVSNRGRVLKTRINYSESERLSEG